MRASGTFFVVIGGAMMAASTSLAGVVYEDPTGDIATGNPNLDITSVTVSDNGYDLGFTITVDNLDADWGKYMLFIDSVDGGSGDESDLHLVVEQRDV